MSVTSCKRRSLEKTGSDTKTEQKISDQYIVTVSSENDDQVTILASNFSEVPQIGDPHPNPESTATVKARNVEPTENRLTWLLNIEYSNATSTSDQPGQGSSTEVLTVTIGKWDETFILESDYAEKSALLKNFAGDKLRYEATRPQFMITLSAITQDPSLDKFFNAQGKVNLKDVRWLGFLFKPDQLLFDEYRATTIGNNTWREDFIFKGKKVPNFTTSEKDTTTTPKGWQPQILNAGFREKLPDGTVRPIQPKEAPGDDKRDPEPVTQPWPLNNDGSALARNELDQKELITFTEFVAFQRVDFNAIFDFNFDAVLTREERRQIDGRR
jgi:hypothetical protein